MTSPLSSHIRKVPIINKSPAFEVLTYLMPLFGLRNLHSIFRSTKKLPCMKFSKKPSPDRVKQRENIKMQLSMLKTNLIVFF